MGKGTENVTLIIYCNWSFLQTKSRYSIDRLIPGGGAEKKTSLA